MSHCKCEQILVVWRRETNEGRRHVCACVAERCRCARRRVMMRRSTTSAPFECVADVRFDSNAGEIPPELITFRRCKVCDHDEAGKARVFAYRMCDDDDNGNVRKSERARAFAFEKLPRELNRSMSAAHSSQSKYVCVCVVVISHGKTHF